MRKFYVFLLMALCALFVTSCDIIGGGESPKEVEVKQIEELPDIVKQHLIKQDSLYSGLIAKIDTLTMELNASQQKVAQLQRDLKKLERPESFWNYMTVGAIILAAIAIVLIFLRGSGLNEGDVNHMVRDYLEKLKSNSSNSTGPVSKKAEDRIIDLEGNIKEVIDAVKRLETEIKNCGKSTPPSTPPSTPSQPEQPKFSKEGYAKLNSGAFFLEILDSNQEGCVFHINFKNENRGEFDIISLDKIKSRNGWQEVVETTGNCTMEDATSYKVEDKGTCEKLSDGKTWEMKSKLKIKISK